jgi:hypothetical protein
LTCLLREELLDPLVFCGELVKIAFFVGQNSYPRIALILGRKGVFIIEIKKAVGEFEMHLCFGVASY